MVQVWSRQEDLFLPKQICKVPHALDSLHEWRACFVLPAGQLFSAIVTKALQGLPTLAAFDNNPDMADDTFLLIDRAVRYSPGVVFNPQMLPLIADAAMTGVLVQHRSPTQL